MVIEHRPPMPYHRQCHDIIVRPFAARDAPALCAAVQSSITSLSYWFSWCRADYSLADAEARVAHCMDAWECRAEFPFGIFGAHADQLLGCTGLSRADHARQSADIGYWVGEPFRGRGVATSAASLVASIGFGDLGFARLEIRALSHNAASRRVAEKLGATREGEAQLAFHGQAATAIVYSLLPGRQRLSPTGQTL